MTMAGMTRRSDRAKRAMDPYGLRAMTYVQENCPRRYAAIPDPVSFFAQLGEEMRTAVTAAAETLANAPGPPDPTTPEGWAERHGQANMAALMAEEKVFSEMLWTVFPSETDPEEEDEETGWNPLLPDLRAIAEAETEDRHT
jgi:hypothetical protein